MGSMNDQDYQRSRNRAKQARFRARNKHRLNAAARAVRLRRGHGQRGRRPEHYVIELLHPAGEHAGLPAAVVVVRGSTDPVDASLIDAGPDVVDWLDKLRESDLGPVRCHRWVPSEPMSKEAAKRVRNARIATIIRWSGCRPEWFCRS